MDFDDDLAFARSLFRRSGWADLQQARIEPVESGMSDASVYRVVEDGAPRRFLKTAQGAAAHGLREETARTRWLAQRGMRVPQILRVGDEGDRAVLLTAALPGVAADANALPPPVEAIARALKALHALRAADCPFDETLAVRLARAVAAVAAGEVDVAEFEPRNRATTPEALLARLLAGQPNEDIVVVHGDATLSNIFIGDDGGIGFVDCGNAGRGDRYADLAVLAADIAEQYGDDTAARFIRAYDLPWDAVKARYFADLYELF